MAEKPNKEQRKARLRELRQREADDAEARLPMSLVDLAALLSHLDEGLDARPCDHTLALTRGFLIERTLPHDRIIPWLAEQGGYCDCEVLANVESAWSDRLEP
jgi:hypothetical protein